MLILLRTSFSLCWRIYKAIRKWLCACLFGLYEGPTINVCGKETRTRGVDDIIWKCSVLYKNWMEACASLVGAWLRDASACVEQVTV